MLRAELDACFFHLYGSGRTDVEHIMGTFRITQRKDEAAHREFRTRRLVLEAWDALAKATESGEAYASVLEPPPAHPSLAHPAGGPA